MMNTASEVFPPLVAQEYAREVRKRLGVHAHQIILFGSQARGTATEGSDYDFVVVVDRKTRDIRDQVSDAGCALLDHWDVLCAALVYDEAQWNAVRESPLGWNVERDGVSI